MASPALTNPYPLHPAARGWPPCIYSCRVELSTGALLDSAVPEPCEVREHGIGLNISRRDLVGCDGFDQTIGLDIPPGAVLADIRVGPAFEAGSLGGFRLHPLPFKVGLDGVDATRSVHSLQTFAAYAEGWILEDGARGCVVMRLPSPDSETCFVPVEVRESRGVLELQFGAIGSDGPGHQTRSPFIGRELGSGWFDLPVTRYVFFEGGWAEGVRLFREAVLEALGPRMSGYRPLPVSYNTYHDFGPSYSRGDLSRAMERAKGLGVGLVHLDPGWETVWGSTAWDEERLGSPEDFVAEAASFGLKVGCWTSLHTTDPGIAEDCYALGPAGGKFIAEDFGEVKLYGICPASRWADVYRRNIGRLIRAGFEFVNSDFHDWPWNGLSCHDPAHGHPVPLSRQSWCEALNTMFGRLHESGPVTVEMHDHVESGEYRTPVWYLYNRPESYDEKWAYEFMWKTHQDLLDGRLFALYHLRNAEPVPLFLHMNMISDNENALAFWYVASCVNHVGIGGAMKASELVLQGYRRAIAAYNEHFQEFTVGQFVGIDELTHLHIHPQRTSAVLLCFNLTEAPIEREVMFDLRATAPDIAAGCPDGILRSFVSVGAKDVSLVPLKFKR